ncbi:MAG: hypothetical protein KAH56_13880 [Candidatus Krumholzibacteria bacterium]|nr:hypothetical protein [Candidatus Krumholzibacteria bacterium]
MKTKLIMLMLLCVVLITSGATAKEVVTVTQLDPADIPPRTSSPATEMVGNLNAAYWLLGGWFAGQESYAYIFNPSEQVTCNTGFQVISVHMYLDFEPADVPVTFEVYADLGSAVLDPTSGCYVPGPEECTGTTYTVTIDVAGAYDISIPLDCECAYIFDPSGAPYIYYLSMHYPTAFTARVVTDNIQAACMNYNDWGEGWADLDPYFTTYGTINMYADVICCSDPVGTESRSWGDVKSLFR